MKARRRMVRKTSAVAPRLGDPEWFSPEARKARQRKLTRQVLGVHRRRYELTNNPVFVWEAIAMLQGASLPMWVRKYLARVATRVAELSRTEVPRKHQPPRAVYQALEFGPGGANPFTAISDSWHSVSLALEVWWAMADGTKADFAIDAVVGAHPLRCTREPKCETISRTTVGRAWRRHRASIESHHPPEDR